MKKIINTEPFNIDGVLLVARIVIAALMLGHGIPKLGMLMSEEPIAFPAIFGMSPGLSLVLAIFAEVICSVLVLFGILTRLAVIPLITTMLVAVFYIHIADPFAKQELGLLYLLTYVILLVTGSGKYSIDRLLAIKMR